MKKNYKWHYCRHMRTTQERRVNGRRGYIEEDGYKIKIRAKRSEAQLPCCYEDYWIHTEKCWKFKRKTQYKQNPHSVFFTDVEEKDYFKSGGRLYQKVFGWGYSRRAIEVETGKRVFFDCYDLVEYPVKE